MGLQSKAILTPLNVAVQDQLLHRFMTEFNLLKAEMDVPTDALALAGFAIFAGACLSAKRNPTIVFRELVDTRDV